MSSMDVFSNISTLFNSFTKSEKRVAEYILQNRSQIMYMSITELSDATKVGEASIFRFCKTVGLEGYQAFKIALANASSEEKTSQKIYSSIQKEDSMEILTDKVRVANISAIESTAQLVNPDHMEKAVDYLVAADKITFFGVGSSFTTALD